LCWLNCSAQLHIYVLGLLISFQFKNATKESGSVASIIGVHVETTRAGTLQRCTGFAGARRHLHETFSFQSLCYHFDLFSQRRKNNCEGVRDLGDYLYGC
jgi:hypothetical protein